MRKSKIYKECLEYLNLMNEDDYITAITTKDEFYDIDKMSFKDAIWRKNRYLKGKTPVIGKANIEDLYDFYLDDEKVTVQGLFRCEIETVLTSLPVLSL